MLDNVMGWFGDNLVLTGVGATVITWLFFRIFPNRKISWAFYRICWNITIIMRAKVGDKFWIGLRRAISETLQVIVKAIVNGLAHIENIEILGKKGTVGGIRWDSKRKEHRLYLSEENPSSDQIEKKFEPTI